MKCSIYLQLEATGTLRLISSHSIDRTAEKSVVSEEDLKNRLLGFKFRNRSAVSVLQNWVDDGHKVSVSGLQRITGQLVKSKRYNHALEILTWMEAQKGFHMSAADHAIRLDLIIKVHGLTVGEQYFERLTSTASRKAACSPLLRGYVKEKNTEKAEAFMLKLTELGLNVTPHPFNEMMKLYTATSQCRKVLLVISHMKKHKIPLNVLSYNLWITACGEISGIYAAEKAYREMVNDEKVEMGWSTLSTLANVYIKAGLVQKALSALDIAEKKLSNDNRHGYFFLITLHTSLNNIDGVIRLWKASKTVPGRIPQTNYMCILLSLVKMGNLAEAERIFMEWEANCWKYDIRVSNVLLGAYVRKQLIDKAESFHLHTLENGGCPNYKTCEILMEGWVKSQQMEKAVNAMKKGFALMKECDWRPSQDIVMAIAEYFEEHDNLEEANQYVRDLHHVGLTNLPLYQLLIRMHVKSHRPVSEILKMMEKDNISMEGETFFLVGAVNM